MKSAFLPSEGLLCLYDKQNNSWLLVDMEFLFSCSTRHLTRSLRALVSYRVKHSKRNSISTRTYVLFSTTTVKVEIAAKTLNSHGVNTTGQTISDHVSKSVINELFLINFNKIHEVEFNSY